MNKFEKFAYINANKHNYYVERAIYFFENVINFSYRGGGVVLYLEQRAELNRAIIEEFRKRVNNSNIAVNYIKGHTIKMTFIGAHATDHDYSSDIICDDVSSNNVCMWIRMKPM